MQADLALASAPRDDMEPGARRQLAELIVECERLLFGDLAAVRGDDWYVDAIAALNGAAERLRWAARHPFMLGDWPALVDAARLLGRAQHAVAVGRSRRHKPGRPLGSGINSGPILRVLEANPAATNGAIADAVAAEVAVDAGQVAKVRKRAQRRK
ncbi:MAG: hypothetical protein Q7U73_04970 [Rubrivivax sp.]|nr:hypothetical protein [Rubrivivax sp.]